MTDLEELKFNLREANNPYFSDTELQRLLDKYTTVDAASYHGLLIKAEDDSIKLTGLDIPSSQKYFLRLARKFRPSVSGTVKRADGV